MKKTVQKMKMKSCLLLVIAAMSLGNLSAQTTAPAPELIFRNPVLKAGVDKKEGAVYRFTNIAPGVDAELVLKKFSRSQIVMNMVDNTALGWDKAFQPEFGLSGIVQPNQNWYIDFELKFFETGTSRRMKMSKIDLTTLDVDGDGVSISEYVVMNNATAVSFSTVSYLNGSISQPLAIGQNSMCSADSVTSSLVICNFCMGNGSVSGWPCDPCDGSGKVFSSCQDAYLIPTTVQGPIQNFANIDTSATQVMATYSYQNVDQIRFRYGAKSGNTLVNGSGVRLNSLWFRRFSLAPTHSLPVRLSSFSAFYEKSNVTLNWTTDLELNFSHFVVERSSNGRNFTEAAIVFSDQSFSNYKFRDLNVSAPGGILFYRLKMVDKTNEVTYSAVRIIRTGLSEKNTQILIYPNPFTDELNIELPHSWQNKTVVLEVYDARGSSIQKQIVVHASQTETMRLTNFPAGIYLIRASADGESKQQQVIKK